MDIPQQQRPTAPPAPKEVPADWEQRLLAKQVLPDKAPKGAAAESLDLSPLPPDYRFRTAASAALDGRVLSRRRYDRSTCELADYLSARNECGDEGERSAVERRFGAVAVAVRAHSGSHRELGFLIEAYILARLWSHDFRSRVRMESAAVQLYQKFFCDYGALLDNRAYVIRHARIEEALMSTDPTLQRKGILLLIGYFCGWRALDQLVWTRVPGTGGHVWTNLHVTLEQVRLFEMVRNAVLAAFTSSVPPRTASDYTALAADLAPLIDRHGLSNTPTQNFPSLPPMP